MQVLQATSQYNEFSQRDYGLTSGSNLPPRSPGIADEQPLSSKDIIEAYRAAALRARSGMPAASASFCRQEPSGVIGKHLYTELNEEVDHVYDQVDLDEILSHTSSNIESYLVTTRKTTYCCLPLPQDWPARILPARFLLIVPHSGLSQTIK